MTSALISISTRVTLLTLGIFFLTIWSLAALASRLLQDEIEAEVGKQQISAVAIHAAQVQSALETRFAALGAIARRIEPATMRNPAGMRSLLQNEAVLQKLFNAGVFVALADGTLVAAAPEATTPFPLQDRTDAFLNSVIGADQHDIGGPIIANLAGAPMFVMSAPIYDAQGRVTGALLGTTDLSTPNFLDPLTQHRYGETGHYFLASTQERINITSSDKLRIMQPLPAAGVIPAVDRFIAGHGGSARHLSQRGQEVLTSVQHIPLVKWAVVASMPTAEAFAPVVALQRNLFQLALLASLVCGGLCWWFMRVQLAPLRAAAQNIAKRVQEDEITAPLPVGRNDEVGTLIAAFNRQMATLVQMQTSLAAYQRFTQNILDVIPEAVVMMDGDLNITWTNDAHVAVAGYERAELVGKNWRILLGPASDAASLPAMEAAVKSKTQFSAELRCYRKDGSLFWNALSLSPINDKDGAQTHFIGVTRDASAGRAAADRAHLLAFFDPLTALPNRRLLIDRLHQTIALNKRNGGSAALMFLDLDNFKLLNDSRGHAVGDMLLIAVAGRLKASIREIDTVARLGGDEFVVMLTDLSPDRQTAILQARAVAEKILSSLAVPHQFALAEPDHPQAMIEHQSTASIGVVLFSDGAHTVDDLLELSDKAMYRAKASGRNRIIFAGVDG